MPFLVFRLLCFLKNMKICSVQVEYVVVFVFIVNAVGKCSCFRVERLSTGAGDVFEKNSPITVDGSTMTISDCNVGGEGNGYWKNSTHCQCSYGETFVIDWDRRKAKCMEEYGEDKKDMGELKKQNSVASSASVSICF